MERRGRPFGRFSLGAGDPSSRASRLQACCRAALAVGLGVLQIVSPSLVYAAGADIDLPAGESLGAGPAGGGGAASGQLGAAVSASGEARASLPIAAPPGPGGHTPTLSVTYRSGRGNGPLGVGWGLDLGPTVLRRSTKDGAPNYCDPWDMAEPRCGAPYVTGPDRFELDGVDLYETDAGYFVTERDAGARIYRISFSGVLPGYWVLLQPDGTRRYYGVHASFDTSRVDNPGVRSAYATHGTCGLASLCALFEPSNTEEIVPPLSPNAWYLDRIVDRNGNVIRLDWTDRPPLLGGQAAPVPDPGVRYLAAIRYGGHTGDPVDEVPDFLSDAGSPPDRTIAFLYEPRPDVVPTFRGGFRAEIRHRLRRIEISWGG